MNLLSMAQEYVRILPNAEGDKDESWETPQARAESVLAAFLRDRGEPVWKLTFVWIMEDSTRSANNYFILEESLDQYVEECKVHWTNSPNGSPARIIKCLTHTQDKL